MVTWAMVVLGPLGPLGLVSIFVLQDQADRATQHLCRVNPSAARWHKGYGFALPVGVLLVLMAAFVLALVVLFAFRPACTVQRPVRQNRRNEGR
jgi:hypothetical protein